LVDAGNVLCRAGVRRPPGVDGAVVADGLCPAGSSCSTSAIEAKCSVKSRLSLRAQRQMSGAPGGDATLLSCTRDEGISLEFGTKPGGARPCIHANEPQPAKFPCWHCDCGYPRQLGG